MTSEKEWWNKPVTLTVLYFLALAVSFGLAIANVTAIPLLVIGLGPIAVFSVAAGIVLVGLLAKDIKEEWR